MTGMSGVDALPGARPLSLKEKLFIRGVTTMNRLQRGHAYTDYVTAMVRAHGIGEMSKFGRVVDESLKVYEATYGPFIIQLLTGLSAMWTGCTYCSVGHVLTANLHWYKAHGELTGLDEGLIYWLQRKTDDDVHAYLRQVFSGDKHKRTVELIERLYAIRAMEAEGETADDDFLRAAAATWDWVNECSIRLDPVKVPPMDRLGKDRKLLRRYEEARQAWRAEQPDYPSEAERLPWKRIE
jgi:hypothetical protein